MNYSGLEAWDLDMDATLGGTAWELGVISTPKGESRLLMARTWWLGARTGMVGF